MARDFSDPAAESAASSVRAAVETAKKIRERARFVERPWLVEEIVRRRADPRERRLVVVGEPGSGKSTLLAHLAIAWDCPCYFNVGEASANEVLVSIGAQLHRGYGEAAFPASDKGRTTVAVDHALGRSEVIGRRVDHLYVLPFLPLPRRDVSVITGVVEDDATLVGEHIRELHTSIRSVPAKTLLVAALLDPLWRIHQAKPGTRVVVILDALDEAAGRAQLDLVDIIPDGDSQDFPPNLFLLMSSRPGHHLVRFKAGELLRLDDPAHREASQADAERYVAARFAEGPLAGALAALPPKEADELVNDLLVQSRGGDPQAPANFLYLHHYFVEATVVASKAGTDLRAVPRPRGLDEIYRQFALGRIWSGGRVVGGAADRLRAVLGALAVAAEPVDRKLLGSFAGVESGAVDEILSRLIQFLDTEGVEQGNRFRLYHASFRDYLLDATRNRDFPLDPAEHHARIASHYRAGSESWAAVPWSRISEDYPFRYLAAHLAMAGRVEELCALVDRPWFEIQIERFASPAPFIHDAQLVQVTAARERPRLLGEELRACMLRAAAASVAGCAPTQLVAALAALGETQAAIEFAQLVPDVGDQAEAFCELGRALPISVGADLVLRIVDHAVQLALEARERNDSPRGKSPLLNLIRDVLLHVVQAFTDQSTARSAWDLAWQVEGGMGDIRRALLKELSRGGRHEQALAIVRDMVPEARAELHYAVANALVEVGCLEEALTVTLEIPPGRYRASLLSEIACRHASAGHGGDARAAAARLLTDIDEMPVDKRSDVDEYLFVTDAVAGRLDEAQRAAGRVAHPLSKARALDRLCRFCCDKGALEDAASALSALVALNDKVYCTGAAAAIAQARVRAGETVNTDSDLVCGPCREPDEVLLAICVEAARLDRGAEARNVAEAITGNYHRRDALQAIARRLAERGEELAAAELAAVPDAVLSKGTVFDWGAAARARRGDLISAVNLVDAAALTPTERMAAIVSGLAVASADTPERDLRMAAMFVVGLSPEADLLWTDFPGAVETLRRRDLLREADRLVGSALDRAAAESDNWTRCFGLARLAPLLNASGEREKSRGRAAVLREIGRLRPPARSPFREPDSAARLVRALVSAGLAERTAIELPVEVARAFGVRRALVTSLVEAGCVDKALAEAEATDDERDRSELRRAAVATLWKTYSADPAALSKLAATALRVPTWKCEELRELVAGLAAHGQVLDAAKLSDAIEEAHLRRAAARDVAAALARNGDFAAANAAVSKIDSAFDRAFALADIAACTAAAGRPDEALADLEAALKLPWDRDCWNSAETFDFPDAVGRAIAAIACGGRDEAYGIVKRLTAVDACYDANSEWQALKAAARALGVARCWAAAEKLVRFIDCPPDLPALIQALLNGAERATGFLGKDAAKVAQAAAIRLEGIPSFDERVTASRALAPCLARVGDWDFARKLAYFFVLHLADEWEQNHQRKLAAVGLASVAATQGDLDRVRSIAGESRSLEIADAVMAAAAEAYAVQGDVDSAWTALRWISSSSVLLGAVKTCASALTRAREIEAALELLVTSYSICADFLRDYNSLVETMENSVEILAACAGGRALLDVLGASKRAETFFLLPDGDR